MLSTLHASALKSITSTPSTAVQTTLKGGGASLYPCREACSMSEHIRTPASIQSNTCSHAVVEFVSGHRHARDMPK